MKKHHFILLTLSLILSVLSTSCSDDDPIVTPTPPVVVEPEPEPEPTNSVTISPGENAAQEAQQEFIEVEKGFTINFDEGEYSFVNTLSMDSKEEIVIKGAGMNKTVLDFSQQTSGGDAVLIANSTKIRFEDITIRDSKGDALKTRDCSKVSFVRVSTIWSGEPKSENGAYGLYPVLCSEVLIDSCYAYGASDAGIYVGQSDQVIVRNSTAEGNVAGIEIENTTNADVYNNLAVDNTGGILVFDLPGLTKFGSGVRIYNNETRSNNRINFAPEGNIVANVPTGTGLMVLSTKDVEIFNNKLIGNDFTSIIIANYLLINQDANDPNFNPFPNGIFIHDNEFSGMGQVNVTVQTPIIQALLGVLTIYGLDQPNILSDGLLQSPSDVCIQESAQTTFVNLNAGDQTFSSVTTDITAHNCVNDPLPEVSFTPF